MRNNEEPRGNAKNAYLWLPAHRRLTPVIDALEAHDEILTSLRARPRCLNIALTTENAFIWFCGPAHIAKWAYIDPKQPPARGAGITPKRGTTHKRGVHTFEIRLGG